MCKNFFYIYVICLISSANASDIMQDFTVESQKPTNYGSGFVDQGGVMRFEERPQHEFFPSRTSMGACEFTMPKHQSLDNNRPTKEYWGAYNN